MVPKLYSYLSERNVPHIAQLRSCFCCDLPSALTPACNGLGTSLVRSNCLFSVYLDTSENEAGFELAILRADTLLRENVV